MRFGSFGSPIERRLRRLPEVCAVSSVASVLFAVTPCPAEKVVSSFLSAVVEAASPALFTVVVASKLGVSEVAAAVDVAEAAVLVLLASLVEAGAVDVTAAVEVSGAVIAAFAS